MKKKKEEPEELYRCWRGHAWTGAGMHKREFVAIGYRELFKEIRKAFEKDNSVEMSFWLSE